MPYTIRRAETQDAPALSSIYAPYVEHTAVSFEYTAPNSQEFARRIAEISARYPYLVAVDEATGQPVAYAYAHALHERAAFQYCAEASVYVHPRHHGRGLATMLYARLEDLLRQQGVQQLYVCITTVSHPDPYVTSASIDAHRHLGFEQVGRFDACGWKFGRWYDVTWLRKRL